MLKWHAENAKDNPKVIHATERCAGGIIQAIGHFNLGPNTSPRDIKDFSDSELENASASTEMVKFFLFYERWRRGEVDNSEIYLASVKADCVCFLSFSFDFYIILNIASYVLMELAAILHISYIGPYIHMPLSTFHIDFFFLQHFVNCKSVICISYLF